MGEKEILSVDEVAELLDLHAATIREKAKKSEIPAKKIGKEWRFSRRALMAFIESVDGFTHTDAEYDEMRQLYDWAYHNLDAATQWNEHYRKQIRELEQRLDEPRKTK